MEFSKFNSFKTSDYFDESISLIELIQAAIEGRRMDDGKIKPCLLSACNQNNPIYIKCNSGLLKIAFQFLFDSFPTGNLPLEVSVGIPSGGKNVVVSGGNIWAADRLRQTGEPESQLLSHSSATILLDLASLITNLHGGQLEILKCKASNQSRSEIYSFSLMLPICNYLQSNDFLSKSRNILLKPTYAVDVHSDVNTNLPMKFLLSREESEYLNEIALNLLIDNS